MIRQDLLDGTVSTTRILQKCVLLGNSVGSTAMRDWARKELDGYGSEAELPAYRKIKAQILIDGQNGRYFFKGQSIGPEDLPEVVQEAGIGNEVSLPHGLAELEALAESDDGPAANLSLPGGDMIKRMMNRDIGEPFAQIHRVYYCVMRTSFRGVIEAVRTTLADLIGEMLRVLPDDQMTPSKELADQAVNFMNTGERATIVLNTSQASHGSTSTASSSPPAAEESWWKQWRKRGIVIGIFSMCGATAGVLNYLQIAPWN